MRSRDGKTCPENLSACGGYVLANMDKKRDVTLLATGSEVSIALQAASQLQQDGLTAAVVSMPCWQLFDEQDENYRVSVLGTAPRIAIEAGVQQGWDRYIGENGAFIGMHSFGASAPAEKLFPHFGIAASNIVEMAKKICRS